MAETPDITGTTRKKRFHVEQRRMLALASGVSLLVNIVCVVIFAALLKASVDAEKLKLWVIIACALMLVRLCFHVATTKLKAVQQLRLVQWVNLYTVLVALSGLLWGSVMLLWEPSQPVATQLLLFLFPLAMTAGAVAGLGAWMPTYLAFILPCLTPVVLTALLNDSAFSGIALPAGFYFFAMFMLASNFQSRLREAFTLKHHNEQLVEGLSAQNNQLRAAKEGEEQGIKAKGEFLARVSHELRTPMNGVLGMTQVLESAGLTEQQTKLTSTLRTSAESLSYIIDELLDFSKVEANTLKLAVSSVDIQVLVADLEMIFSEKNPRNKVIFNVDVDDAMPMILEGDYVRIKQLLCNLLNNAFKFTSSGTVTLKLWAREQKQNLHRLHFEVIDTGIGIASSDLEVIFDSFSQADNSSTRSYDGVGLGLTVARELATLMGGQIVVQSEPGKGSAFRFDVSLPAVGVSVDLHKAAPMPLPDESTELCSLEGCTVLLVEDSEINRMVAEALLNNLGCVVSHAENGRVAVDSVSVERFDIVLMDCQMPVMDGYDATRAIRQLAVNHDVPIVALTANAMHGDKEKCLQAGMDDYLSKPFRSEQLHAIFTRLITSQPTDENAEINFRGVILNNENTEKALDQTTFDNLRQLDNGKGLIGRVIIAFKKSIPLTMQSLAEGIKEGDSDKVSMSAHTMKSSSANLGALSFSRQCSLLEAMAREGDLSQVAEEFARLEALLVPVQQELDEEFALAEMRKAA